jgi:Flp pilus assembly protein TadG
MYRDPSRSALRGEHGQASVSLVAVVPGLIVAALAAIQFGMAGYALLSAGNASRAAARASYTGADPAEAARAALPAALSGDARAGRGDSGWVMAPSAARADRLRSS